MFEKNRLGNHEERQRKEQKKNIGPQNRGDNKSSNDNEQVQLLNKPRQIYDATGVYPRSSHFGNEIYREEIKKHRGKERRNKRNFRSSSSGNLSSFSHLGSNFYQNEDKKQGKTKKTSSSGSSSDWGNNESSLLLLDKGKYHVIILSIDDDYLSEENGKIIDLSKEEQILSNLINTAASADATIDIITTALISAATELRRIAVAKASCGNYCLSFFCCTPPPVQYTESRLYNLIENALQTAAHRGIIQKIDLKHESNPSVFDGSELLSAIVNACTA